MLIRFSTKAFDTRCVLTACYEEISADDPSRWVTKVDFIVPSGGFNYGHDFFCCTLGEFMTAFNEAINKED